MPKSKIDKLIAEGKKNDPNRYVVFTIRSGAYGDDDLKLMTFDVALKKALEIVEEELGDTFSAKDKKEIIAEAKADLKDRRWWSDEHELDIYIKYVEQ